MLILVACEKTIGILAWKMEVICMRGLTYLTSSVCRSRINSSLSFSCCCREWLSSRPGSYTHTHTQNFSLKRATLFRPSLQFFYVREEKVRKKCSFYTKVLPDVNSLTISSKSGHQLLYVYGGTIQLASMARPLKALSKKAGQNLKKWQCHLSLNSLVHIHIQHRFGN